ncbi:DUF6935 domain-containing protein [Leptospira yasudae]|uniref:DUF6935 domain-containing protein n=1 Tax=Leptospira yasudae TaxID=2202201 RepID=UPI003CCFE725
MVRFERLYSRQYTVFTYGNRDRFSGTKESEQRKLFFPSSGADSERPVTLRRNAKRVWKAREFSNLLAGIKKPVTKVAADDL